MGTGTDATIEASDLTLVRGDLWVVADAIRLSRRTLRTIEGNLFILGLRHDPADRYSGFSWRSLSGLAQGFAEGVGGSVEFGRIWVRVRVAEIEVVDAPGGEHMHMQVRYLEPSDDEPGTGRVECGLLRGTDVPRHYQEMCQQVVVGISPLVDLTARDDQGVPRPQRSDGQERNAAVIAPYEAAWDLALDDAAEQRRHDSPPVCVTDTGSNHSIVCSSSHKRSCAPPSAAGSVVLIRGPANVRDRLDAPPTTSTMPG